MHTIAKDYFRAKHLLVNHRKALLDTWGIVGLSSSQPQKALPMKINVFRSYNEGTMPSKKTTKQGSPIEPFSPEEWAAIAQEIQSLPKVPWRVLSIRQPWAWLITHQIKDVENRTWNTSYRGRFLIHAGKTLDPDHKLIRDDLSEWGIAIPAKLDCGGIVGVAMLSDVITKPRSAKDDFFEGPYGFLLEDMLPLPFTPLSGKLGLFTAEYHDLDYHSPEA